MALNPAVRAMVETAAAKYGQSENAAGLLEWMTPFGKPLGDCTDHEIAALAAFFNALAGSYGDPEPLPKPRIRVRATTQQTA